MPTLSILAVGFFAARVAWRLIVTADPPVVLIFVWSFTILATAVQLLLSIADKPARPSPREVSELSRLNVVAVIPVYNEDPALLDRSIWSLMNSSRPPNAIHVVEDGPSADYSGLRAHWTCFSEISWHQLPANQGKRCAHVHGFLAHPEADVFITVDSDTAVEYKGIEEALKPLADPDVMSVAFIEEIINKNVNILTWISQAASMVFQFTAWGAQSALGDLIVNRGTCALYRASVIREIVPAYINETFFGHPIRLGDDSALTLFSRGRGRTVQQVTAFSLPVYPQTLNHHVRQRLRWARGSTLRHLWRIRYLSPLTYAWWFVISYEFLTLFSVGLVVSIALSWPVSAVAAKAIIEALALSGFATSFRTACVKRNDDRWWVIPLQIIACPLTVLWRIVFLRFVRYYGMLTFLKQGWATRQRGPEISLYREAGEPIAEDLLPENA